MNNVISTSGLRKRYGDKIAVDNLALRIPKGEIYGFLGLNGAGKTTTIRMLLGMIRPDAGSITLLGEEVRAGAHELWGSVGYMVETPHAYPELTVRENLDIVRRLHHLRTPNVVARIMEHVALTPYADHRTRTLSLGNKQRLGLAKALLHDPQVLVLDEPTNGLDPAGVVEVRELLRDLAKQHDVTVFMSSHVLGEVARLATRIGVLHQGRLITEFEAGALEGQRQRHLRIAVRDREAASSVLRAARFTPRSRDDGMMELHEERAVTCPDAIASLLVRADAPPTHLAVHQEDLESYFLRLVGADHGSRS